ncbi:pimeloyl-ACP methyl ester carboxylesterase [Crenobacter luteus]|uniref:alpha/beta fold hydrolase n=1 Tax=Crenobacter luteus TaxID=1452487 RepID=UPI0010EFB4F7|nr:alpha/beta hydrolase [Crenobacter luteus]TCP07866.1 pimeloyl-ACP methyl ester carboxylesterase [Crenobacter luteus]
MMPTARPSHSTFLALNRHRHHVRTWPGATDGPTLFLQHGWMDCSASFQFLVDALPSDWTVIAMDWRGFGESDWNVGGYYSPDYLADLDALLEHFSPHRPVWLAGHSMGGMVASLYAGVRPERVAKLASLEGFGLPATKPAEAPGRYARWLRETRDPPRFGALESVERLAERQIERNRHLTPERARHLAAALTVVENGALRYRADPRHKMVNPVLYRLEEAMACWRRIKAPVLWLIGGDSWDHPIAHGVMATLGERRACFARLAEVTIADAGHMLHIEQPEACARALVDFFSAAGS